MKLLLDQNLSPRLLVALQDRFPSSLHVRDLGLGSADDWVIWNMAAEEGYAILSKDEDFHQLALVRGAPPKVIWLRVGNCSTEAIADSLRRKASVIQDFDSDSEGSFLVLDS